ncbi:hypothetical protein Syun_003555 [Stephania yunnanensis]|uniref:Uncharacterized protein n=1 Tax=Stephania yunnanensis TaxID=152371 RepID=A0AAP0Q0B9_9MAGN
MQTPITLTRPIEAYTHAVQYTTNNFLNTTYTQPSFTNNIFLRFSCPVNRVIHVTLELQPLILDINVNPSLINLGHYNTLTQSTHSFDHTLTKSTDSWVTNTHPSISIIQTINYSLNICKITHSSTVNHQTITLHQEHSITQSNTMVDHSSLKH